MRFSENLMKNFQVSLSVDLANFYLPKVTFLRQMFYNCKSLQYLNISNFNATYIFMDEMFYNCYSLTSIDLPKIRILVDGDIYSTFYNCSSLISIDLSNYYFLNLQEMGFSFYNCSSLISIKFF